MESNYKISFYSILAIIVMGLIAMVNSILKSIDLTDISFWNCVRLTIVICALFVACEMIYSRIKNQ